MRWHILRTLLYKELRRNTNRGSVTLMALLVVMAMLLSFFSTDRKLQGGVGGIGSGVKRCYVNYWVHTPWIAHLEQSVPQQWKDEERLEFRLINFTGIIGYPQETGAIQIRPLGENFGPPYLIWFWHPDNDPSSLAPYEAWFWKETRRYHQNRLEQALQKNGSTAASSLPKTDLDKDDMWAWMESYRFFQQRAAAELERLDPETRAELQVPDLKAARKQLKGGMSPQSAIATALVLFSLFFACVYNMPSLTCEERERGILLAQALSPASPWEIVAAKYLFYTALGITLAALLAGIYRPAVLASGFFWLALVAASCGSLGLGMTIATLARTQRAASMGALSYTMAVTLLIVICEQNSIPAIPWLVLEFHIPRMFHAVLADAVLKYHWFNLAATAALAVIWSFVAMRLFRKRGWQ